MDREQLDQLVAQARGMAYSPTKVALLEEAVQGADALQDLDLAFAVRVHLVDAGVFSGMAERALVAFAWCLAQSDRDPERFPQARLLWEYKWIVNKLPDFPTIPRGKIRAMEEDYHARLKREGQGLRSLYKLLMDNANSMGYRRAGIEYEKTWRRARRDDMSDCAACDLDAEVAALNRAGRYREALWKAQIGRAHV